MRQCTRRIWALVLALLLTIPALSVLSVSAVSQGDSFVFDALYTSNGKTYTVGDDGVTLPISSSSNAFLAKDIDMLDGSSNALYVSLLNNSGASAICITYTYLENAVQREHTLTHSLTPHTATVQTLTLGAPYIGNEISSVSLSFSGAGEIDGSITLYSFFNLSTYVDEGGEDVTLSRCHYNPETECVEIEGELSYEATVFYAGQTLALFALPVGEELHLSSKTPIARTGVTFNFSFSVPADTSDALFLRYVIAVVNEKGERIPLSTPMLPTVKTVHPQPETGFKGFHSQSLSTVLDVTPGTELVDVYLDRLHGTQSNGILYAGEHSYYYFDQDYVNEIDRRVRNLVGIGAHVYLRFLISPDANGLSYADYSEADIGVVNKLPAIRSEAAQQDIYALTNFLTARYSTDSIGMISGIVLGRSADRAFTHSYTSATDLATYSDLYTAALNLISCTAACNIPGIRIVVPLSDRVWQGDVSELAPGKDYYTEFFLPSLLLALQTQIMEPQRFCVMLESSALPDRVQASDGSAYGVDRLGEFLSLHLSYGGRYHFLDSAIFFSFLPQGNVTTSQLKAAYLFLYMSLLRNGNVQAFFADFSLAEANGDQSAMRALSYLARYIDTNKSHEVSESAMTELGIGSIFDLFEDLESYKVFTRQIHRTPLSPLGYGGMTDPVGSYTLWNFTQGTGTMGWYAGTDCQSVSVLTDANGTRSLTASMYAGGEYADIAYHFGTPTDLSFAPFMAIKVGIDAKTTCRYEIQLRLYGTEDTVICSAIVDAGKTQTLYMDLSKAKQALCATQSIRVVARPLDGDTQDFSLHVYTLVLESDVLGDEELSERVIAIGQGKNQASVPSAKKHDYKKPLIISAAVLVVSAALIAFFALGQKSVRALNKKRSDNK